MPGLDPGVHVALEMDEKTLDCRVKPGNGDSYSCMAHYYTGR